VILTDREIKIYLDRGLITINPHPDPAVAYNSTAVDLTLDPIISEFKTQTQGIETTIDPSGKSSLSRLGLAVHMTAPTIHAGFEG
jgi:dCTP deaminase